MPRGGARAGAGAKGSWQSGKTKTIRVPEALADDILELARRLDEGEDFESDTDSNIDEVIEILRDALTLRANAGGAIKARIREALELLGFDGED
jgi:hypothetical protein